MYGQIALYSYAGTINTGLRISELQTQNYLLWVVVMSSPVPCLSRHPELRTHIYHSQQVVLSLQLP